MPWLSRLTQKSNSLELTSEVWLIKSSSYFVSQNYMHIPTKNLLSPFFICHRQADALTSSPPSCGVNAGCCVYDR